jgi:uncharacterized surface protein with fasciclin (FAS1) repeats
MPLHLTRRRGAQALVAALAVGALAAAPAQAKPAEAATAPSNIVETAAAAGQFTTLVALVKQAGLAGTLSTGRYTVFAPTDAAFKKVPKKTLDALAKDKAMLKSVLLYHVAKGRLGAKQVVKRSSIKTLNGNRVRVRVRGGNVFLNSSKVVTANVRASNGIIHAVNRVLIP